MALIICPECGKEISDKAVQCIYCGNPLHSQNKDLYDIVGLFDEFMKNPDGFNRSALVFADRIEPMTEKAKAECSGYDSVILDKLTDMVQEHSGLFGWPAAKKLFSMIDFKKVSSEQIDRLALALSGAVDSLAISLAYPAKLVLIYGNSKVVQEFRDKLLQTPTKLGNGSVMESIESFYQSQKNQDISEYRRETRSREEVLSSVKKIWTVRCPRCGSTDISTSARGVSLLKGFIGASKSVNRCAKCGKMWEVKK